MSVHSPLTLPPAAPTIHLHLRLPFHLRLCSTLRLPQSMGLARARHSTSREPIQTPRRHRMALRLHPFQPLRALNQNRRLLRTRAAVQEEGRRAQTKSMSTSRTCSQTVTMARIPLEISVLCGTAKRKLVVLLRRRRGSAQTTRLLSSSSSRHKIQSNPSFLFSMEVWVCGGFDDL